jgi:hypothetical protein
MNVSKKGVRERFGLPGTEISYQSKRVQGSSCWRSSWQCSKSWLSPCQASIRVLDLCSPTMKGDLSQRFLVHPKNDGTGGKVRLLTRRADTTTFGSIPN